MGRSPAWLSGDPEPVVRPVCPRPWDNLEQRYPNRGPVATGVCPEPRSDSAGTRSGHHKIAARELPIPWTRPGRTATARRAAGTRPGRRASTRPGRAASRRHWSTRAGRGIATCGRSGPSSRAGCVADFSSGVILHAVPVRLAEHRCKPDRTAGLSRGHAGLHARPLMGSWIRKARAGPPAACRPASSQRPGIAKLEEKMSEISGNLRAGRPDVVRVTRFTYRGRNADGSPRQDRSRLRPEAGDQRLFTRPFRL